MKFEVQFYKKNRRNHISDFILSLDEEAQLDVLALFRRMEENPFTLGSLSKKVKSVKNLFELKIRAKDITIRFFYCYRKNKIIIILHGFVKSLKRFRLKNSKLLLKERRKLKMNDLDILEKKLRNSVKDFNKKYLFAKTRLELAIQIAEEREKAGISQKELANKLNTTQSVISRIENGKQNISLDMLQKIAIALDKKHIQIVFS